MTIKIVVSLECDGTPPGVDPYLACGRVFIGRGVMTVRSEAAGAGWLTRWDGDTASRPPTDHCPGCQ